MVEHYQTKQLSGLKMNDNTLQSMANTITNGNMVQLALKISETFRSVTEDLAPLVTTQPQQYGTPAEYIVSMDDVERRLMKVKIRRHVDWIISQIGSSMSLQNT